MHAIVVAEDGVLTWREVPDLTPGEGEVLIRGANAFAEGAARIGVAVGDPDLVAILV